MLLFSCETTDGNFLSFKWQTSRRKPNRITTFQETLVVATTSFFCPLLSLCRFLFIFLVSSYPPFRRRCRLHAGRRLPPGLHHRAAAGPAGFPLPNGHEHRSGERCCPFLGTFRRRRGGGGPGSLWRGSRVLSRRGRRSGGAVRGLRPHVRPREAAVAREGRRCLW